MSEIQDLMTLIRLWVWNEQIALYFQKFQNSLAQNRWHFRCTDDMDATENDAHSPTVSLTENPNELDLSL